jgi:hypothetical protein
LERLSALVFDFHPELESALIMCDAGNMTITNFNASQVSYPVLTTLFLASGNGSSVANLDYVFLENITGMWEGRERGREEAVGDEVDPRAHVVRAVRS